jgi:hypothetical protein
MLLALEFCVLSHVAALLLLALVDLGVIEVPSTEGTWEYFLGCLSYVAPYLTLAIPLLFAFVVLLAYIWRNGRRTPSGNMESGTESTLGTNTDE